MGIGYQGIRFLGHANVQATRFSILGPKANIVGAWGSALRV